MPLACLPLSESVKLQVRKWLQNGIDESALPFQMAEEFLMVESKFEKQNMGKKREDIENLNEKTSHCDCLRW